MRILLAALGLYGIYRFFLRRQHGSPRALLQDMRSQQDRGSGRRRRRDARPVRRVTYEVVEHDSGWAYKVGDVFSEAYATRPEAVAAAERAAAAHQSEGDDEAIEYQDRYGRWHEEFERGDSRPEATVDQQPGVRH